MSVNLGVKRKYGDKIKDEDYIPGFEEEEEEETEEDEGDDEDEEEGDEGGSEEDIKENLLTSSNGGSTADEDKAETNGEENQEVDITLNNVVSNFSVRCHLNLKQIAMTGNNVEFHKEMSMVIMKLRRPRCTASIWSSGKITVTGNTSEDDAKIGARRCARILQRLGFNVRFHNFRIVNVLGTCTMPFGIKIAEFSQAHPREASYEPELHPGVTFRLKEIEATLKIFSTGSITITAPSVKAVQSAVEESYQLVYDFRKKRSPSDLQNYPIAERKRMMKKKRRRLNKNNY